MKLSTRLALLTVTTGFLATSAFAETVLNASKNKVYISADVGYGSLSTPDKDLIESNGYGVIDSSHETGNIAGGINLGFDHVLRHNVLVGAELGFASNGQAKYKESFTSSSEDFTAKINSYDVQILGTATYLLNNGLNVFAKAGPAFVKQTLDCDSNCNNDDDSVKKVKPLAAIGVGYNIKAYTIYLQYSHIFGKNAGNFSDLVDDNGSMDQVVSVDAIKAGVGFNIAI